MVEWSHTGAGGVRGSSLAGRWGDGFCATGENNERWGREFPGLGKLLRGMFAGSCLRLYSLIFPIMTKAVFVVEKTANIWSNINTISASVAPQWVGTWPSTVPSLGARRQNEAVRRFDASAASEA